MNMCEACVKLVGVSAEVRPHDALRLGHVELGNRADEEEWHCNDCGARLFRFSKGSVLSRGNLGVWEKY